MYQGDVAFMENKECLPNIVQKGWIDMMNTGETEGSRRDICIYDSRKT